MPYATQADLLQRVTLLELTQLTDDAKTGQINASMVAGALEEASGTVDSYCRDRYTTPLQPSDTVTRIARDVATYLLFSRRPSKMREDVRQRYEDAMSILKDIAKGNASIDQPASAVTPQSNTAGPVLSQTITQRFTDDDLTGFV